MDLRRLKEEQVRLARKIVLKDECPSPKTLGGADVFYTSNKMIGVVVVIDAQTMQPIESKYAVTEPRFPYIPDFLSYREAPVLVEAFTMLRNKPDVLIIDGNGILHPQGIGCASHLGLLLDIPTIGVAKKLLFGEIQDNEVFYLDQRRAMILSTKQHANPLVVSPGHRISMTTSVKIVAGCLKDGKKMPEPLRQAHKLGLSLKKRLETGQPQSPPLTTPAVQVSEV